VSTDAVKVAVLAPHLGEDLGYVRQIDRRVTVIDANHVLRDGPESAPELADAEVLVVGMPVPPTLLPFAPAARWAHHTQAGVSNLLGSDLWASTIMLTSSRGSVGVAPIAESAMAGIFYFARGLDIAIRDQQAGTFTRRSYLGDGAMRTLTGATIGIVGYGGIGRALGQLARSAGMRVIANRRSVSAAQLDVDGADLLLPVSELERLLAESDFVVICSQLTPETRGMFDAEVFAAMKPGSVLVNIARGEEVHTDALVGALRSGHLRGNRTEAPTSRGTRRRQPA